MNLFKDRFEVELERKRNDFITTGEKIEKEYIELLKKYETNPKELLKDYDDIIKDSIIAIIANYNATTVLRGDMTSQVDILIRNREFVRNQYCNNSSNKN